MNKSEEYYNHSKLIFKDAINLYQNLWNILELGRGHMPMMEFRRYFLALFFYKFLSDNNKSTSAISDNSYIIPKYTSFEDILLKINQSSFPDDVNNAINGIEKANDKLLDVFNHVDFTIGGLFGSESNNQQLVQLILAFKEINLSTKVVSKSTIEMGFEFLLESFAQFGNKLGQELETPPKLSQLLARLLNPMFGDTIHDPACGSASLLIKIYKASGSNSKGHELYGQEINRDAFAIAKMNMIIHGLDDANIIWGDSLRNPGFKKRTPSNELIKFDYVVANPPFNSSQWHKNEDQFDRFKWGMPPDNRSDYAFLSHMLASAEEKKGKVLALVTHSVLFRQGKEQNIRKNIIQEGLLDAVIGLPSNLLSYTGISVVILIFRKDRKKNDTVLFIDASSHFLQERRKNLLTDQGIELILDVYKNYKDETADLNKIIKPNYSNIVSIQQIAENDFNLSINRYIPRFELTEQIDLKALQLEVTALDKQIEYIRNNIKENLRQLGL